MRRLFLLPLLLVLACTEVNIPDSSSPNPVAPSTPTADRIEFRVIGTNLFVNTVNIRHTDPINGVTLYTGGVPYFASVSSTDQSIFLFIEGSSTGQFLTSSLQVQIFVNGRLFREAFSQGFTLQASASGTYRR